MYTYRPPSPSPTFSFLFGHIVGKLLSSTRAHHLTHPFRPPAQPPRRSRAGSRLRPTLVSGPKLCRAEIAYESISARLLYHPHTSATTYSCAGELTELSRRPPGNPPSALHLQLYPSANYSQQLAKGGSKISNRPGPHTVDTI